MIIPLREALLNPLPKYCGLRPKHIMYESAYSILCRFSLFNVIAGGPLVKILHYHCGPAPTQRHRSKNLSLRESLRLEGLQELLALRAWQVESLFLPPTLVTASRHVASALRFCPACLAQGRHYILFQFELIDACPVHGTALLSRCPHCGVAAHYELDAHLFKHPYGCWRCGRQLGTARSRQALHFISPWGAQRLHRAHQLLELGQARRVVFDIASAADFQCDNVLQLSLSIPQFARVEAELFRDLQALACDPALPQVLARYPSFRPTQQPKAGTSDAEEDMAKELISITKSIFRNYRKQHLPRLRLTKALLGRLWRDVQGVSLPQEYYGALAYLDWLSYWNGAKSPGGLPCSAMGGQKKMQAWLSEKKRHSVFSQLHTLASERWLLRRLLACEITTFLRRQVEQGVAQSPKLPEEMKRCYRRLIPPVCWAVFFSEGRSGIATMTFISALSWQVCRQDGHLERPVVSRTISPRDWLTVFQSLSV